jgi:hypothetical protein
LQWLANPSKSFLDELAQQVSSIGDSRNLGEYSLDRLGIHEIHFPKVAQFGSVTTYHFVGMKSAVDELGCVVDDCDSTLTIIDLSRYHEIESNQRPRIINDLELFESITTASSLKNMSRCLIFITTTTLEQDLATHPLEAYFPDYSGQQAELFIPAQFKKIHEKNIAGVTKGSNVFWEWMEPGDAGLLTCVYAASAIAVSLRSLYY